MNKEQTSNTIAIDVMGSDKGPEEIIAGVALAINENINFEKIILVGNEDLINEILEKENLKDNPKIEVLHAGEVITMEDKPLVALKTKKDSSMIRAIECVKFGSADAILSCGNTGALMACGTLRLRPMSCIERPALASIMPRGDGSCFVMLDVGANPEAKPNHLFYNAILGANFAKMALGIENPKVGLLTIGTEEGKGNATILKAHKMLKECSCVVNYTGQIEGYDLFDSKVDVVVCDGSTGNILLKSLESAVSMIKDVLKEELTSSFFRKLGAFISRGAFKSLKTKLSPERYGGAPLLGLNKLVLKAHGSSTRNHIVGAMKIANSCVEKNMNHRISKQINESTQILENITQ